MKFIITGTQAYGPARDDSDLDIVVLANDVQKILSFLDDHNLEEYKTEHQELYNDEGGFYFNLFGIEINIIIAKDKEEFKKWETATEDMKTIDPIKNREECMNQFQLFFNK